jgi:hypothetical protein
MTSVYASAHSEHCQARKCPNVIIAYRCYATTSTRKHMIDRQCMQIYVVFVCLYVYFKLYSTRNQPEIQKETNFTGKLNLSVIYGRPVPAASSAVHNGVAPPTHWRWASLQRNSSIPLTAVRDDRTFSLLLEPVCLFTNPVSGLYHK